MKKALTMLMAGLAALAFASQSHALDPQPEPPMKKADAKAASKRKVAPQAKLKKAKANKAPVAQEAARPVTDKAAK